MNTNDQIREIWKSILEREWNGKPVWEHLKDGILTAAPALEGKQYASAKTKIMYVGRALNGWDAEFTDCKTLEEAVNSVINQRPRFDTIVTKNFINMHGGRYNHKTSKYLRLIKQILECVDESTTPTDETWYSDPKEWQEKYVWANLFPIAPANGGNPERLLMRQSVEGYVELMKNQIVLFQPDVIVFCTDMNWFVPWRRKTAFKDILDSFEETEDATDTIVGVGIIGPAKAIVCKRPDRFGTSYENVHQMAIAIAAEIMKG